MRLALPLTAATDRLERWAADWARRRQGDDPLKVILRRRRIYILPTKFGVLFGLMVFAMLLGALNYAASLAFVLTFLLAGLGLVIMHHCHNTLLGTQLKWIGAQPAFAGEPVEFKIALDNEASTPRFELELEAAGHHAGPVDLPAGGGEVLSLSIPTEHRGWVALGRFAVVTYHPARLFRAWTWVHMNARAVVYPKPAPPGRPLPPSQGAGTAARLDRGDADFFGLRVAHPGDPPQHIAWKAYARSDELLFKQFAGGEQEPCLLDWDALPELDVEARLSQLTRWCLDAAAEMRSFGLRLPSESIPIDNGPQHLARCLQALAVYEASK
jgi:uncharacterized protein (DUF58 family)